MSNQNAKSNAIRKRTNLAKTQGLRQVLALLTDDFFRINTVIGLNFNHICTFCQC